MYMSESLEPFWCVFEKYAFFLLDSNDFVELCGELGATLGAFTLGLLEIYAGDFGSLLGQFWAILTSNGRRDAYRCGLGGAESENVHTSRARSKIKGVLGAPTGRTSKRGGVDFSVTLAPLCALWGHLGVTLGLLCVHEGVFGTVAFEKKKDFSINFW